MQPLHMIYECETPDKHTDMRKTRHVSVSSLFPKKSADRLSVVDAADSLGKMGSNFKDFQLWTQAAMFVLRNAVRYDDLVKSGSVDARDGISTEYAVGEQSVDVCSTLLLQQFGSSCDSIGGIRQIVNEDGNSIGNLANQHHRSILAVGNTGGPTFLGHMSVRKFREMGVLPCGSMRIPYSGRPRLPLLSSLRQHRD